MAALPQLRPPPRLGVCSWSLRPTSPAELALKLREIGVDCCQLHLDPLREGRWSATETVARLRDAGLEIRSGMMSTHGEDYSTLASIRETGGVRPSAHWRTNLAIAQGDARVAEQLALPLVSFHAGFLPHERDDPEREAMLARLRTIVDVFAERGVRVAFETGQESAETLAGVLDELDRPAAGVNFDPANMLLYDMGDPVAALRQLGARVHQIHVKDARRTRVPGTWGEEVPAGTGEVDWRAFFGAVASAKLAVDFMIEREAGDDRIGDIRRARTLVAVHVGSLR